MKKVNGSFVQLDGQRFYKIENYDCMEDFFITLTSSSDVWNFLWSKGGITAGRCNADHAIFQYATCDKVSDFKYTTGSYTAVAITENGKTVFWEPFAKFISSNLAASTNDENIQYNIYKNLNGSKIWFEEINHNLGLAFRYGWTSSKKYGLVKSCVITNLKSEKRSLKILDGAKNIMPALASKDLQNNNSVLLDAYKKTDLDLNTNLALFSLSSAVSDKAEPCEALLSNICWFTTKDKVYTSPNTPLEFFKYASDFAKASDDSMPQQTEVLKGQKPSCFIIHNAELSENKCEEWQSVFDVSLNAVKIAEINQLLQNKKQAAELLNKDIEDTDEELTRFIGEADGIQKTSNEIASVHHRTNVLFNIMRGGFLADNGKIYVEDLLKFFKQRNAECYATLSELLKKTPEGFSALPGEFYHNISSKNDSQIKRLFLEYLPVIFSRRHGDPSRPWNKFNIALTDSKGNQVLNYEGNWRDIFQNWEALLFSYPVFIPNVMAKFVNAMTMDGFNPYRISREGIDWECPEEGNPWASYGYWGDHQIIYLQKLLEQLKNYKAIIIEDYLSEKIFSSSNVPYRLKSYAEICQNPRDTLIFDRKLSDLLIKESADFGSDKKLVQNKENKVYLLNLTAKLLQIIIAKVSNLVPGGGIWMNTQRPEWNDANNALCGWGLSVVTMCYMERMLKFLLELYKNSGAAAYEVPSPMAECVIAISKLIESSSEEIFSDNKARKTFVDSIQKIFEAERNSFYKNYYNDGEAELTSAEIAKFLELTEKLISKSIKLNKTEDELYHTYNTLKINGDEMQVEHLQRMLEGQVAAISSGNLSSKEVIELYDSLKKSPIYEKRQNSFMLYPNKELPLFTAKNNVSQKAAAGLEKFLEKDCLGGYHFNDYCQNSRLLLEWLENSSKKGLSATDSEKTALLKLYEETFNHHSFTGRSGTFYAYEGLGSIYWHMVSKLLLAVQEETLKAQKNGDKNAERLAKIYAEVKAGLGSAKTPELYGAFPYDPYSHTPSMQGAKQPGMTGQVKEEILTRWGELGVSIENGCAIFNPNLLSKEDFEGEPTEFTWCGVQIIYKNSEKEKTTVYFSDNSTLEQPSDVLSEEISEEIFSRSGVISKIVVEGCFKAK
ncbi:MAG: hypothetical protein KBT11_07190 [Treponema sp.]|nr:hypothetical protein [Candidatus Treponema equifaecale]